MAVEPRNNLLGVVSPDELNRREEEQFRLNNANDDDASAELPYSDLVAHVRKRFEHMRNWRTSEGINKRLMDAIRSFKGKYPPEKLTQIQQFGGSTVYARMTAVKCRGATALLRDVYLQTKPWSVGPTPDPDLPSEITADVMMDLQQEVMKAIQIGVAIDQDMLERRFQSLKDEAYKDYRQQAEARNERIENKIEDILIEGRFYDAFAEFLVDLPMFPFAVLKGPVVRIVPQLTWQDGRAVVRNQARMFWERVSPFDAYWGPGLHRAEDGDFLEKIRFTRSALSELIGLPGYREDAIRQVLKDYGHGLRDWLDETDSERSDLEHREDPNTNTTGIIDGVEYHGPIQGSMLREYGMDEQTIPDPDIDYMVQCWVIGRHIIKAQITPAPSKRHPYYITSFEKVPGTVMGNGLPDILHDIQEVANATLRALVNNLSISSGPQVVVHENALAPTENGDDLYPWKRWRVVDYGVSGGKPIDFFQPNSNAAELMGIYEKFSQMADDISAIPRYAMGNERVSGAGRTASGLAMLMGNASKVLQNVAANVDRDVLMPALKMLYDMLILTDETGDLAGDTSVHVKGVSMAIQKETERARQLEFLQVTANPVDLQITGMRGRGAVLREVAETLGMEADQIVPDDAELELKEAQNLAENEMMKQMQMQSAGIEGMAKGKGLDKAAAQAQGSQSPKPGGDSGGGSKPSPPPANMVQRKSFPPR